jgi:hypothetical protein
MSSALGGSPEEAWASDSESQHCPQRGNDRDSIVAAAMITVTVTVTTRRLDAA